MTLTILPATQAHLASLGGRLRRGDELEITCLGIDVAGALQRSLIGSVFARTAMQDGVPIAAWGCGGALLGGVGEPWLMTTPEAAHNPVRFVRVAQREMGAMLAIFPVLSNFVAAEYRQACDFLEFVGFRLGPAIPLGPSGTPYREFRMER